MSGCEHSFGPQGQRGCLEGQFRGYVSVISVQWRLDSTLSVAAFPLSLG